MAPPGTMDPRETTEGVMEGQTGEMEREGLNLTDLQKEAHAIAVDHGWYDTERTFGDFIALVHSEVSEAFEAYRRGGFNTWDSYPDGKQFKWVPDAQDSNWEWKQVNAPKPEGVAYELADVVIRVADVAEWYEWDLGVNADSVKQLFQQEPSRLVGLDSFGNWLTKCHGVLSMAFSMMEMDDERYKETAGWVMAKFVVMVECMATHYDIDLDAAIVTKMEYLRRTER